MRLLTLIRWAVGLALCVAAGLALAFRFGGSHWAVELLRFVPFLAWLGPSLLVFLLSWALPWRWRAAAALALGLVVVDLMQLSIGRGESSHADAQAPLRFMTWNIKAYVAEDRGLGFEPIVAELERQAPDIVVMQDAPILEDAGEPMPEVLAAWLKPRHVYRRDQYVVASRWPLSGCTPHDTRAGEARSEFIACTVQAPGGPIDVVTTHFISPRDGLNATRHERWHGIDTWQANLAERLGQSRRLAAWLAARSTVRPLVLAGDLNAPERSDVVRQLLRTGLRDAFSAAGTGWGFTHGHSLRPYITFLRIDHILVNADVSVQKTWVGGREASEHRPVVVDLRLPAPR